MNNQDVGFVKINFGSFVFAGVLFAATGKATFASTYAHTQPATQIAQTNAILNGMALANGLASMAWFEWGERGSYSNTTSSLNVGSGITVMCLNQGIVSLIPGGVYQYRLVVRKVHRLNS